MDAFTAKSIKDAIRNLKMDRWNEAAKRMSDYDVVYQQKLREIQAQCEKAGHQFMYNGKSKDGTFLYWCPICGKTENRTKDPS